MILFFETGLPEPLIERLLSFDAKEMAGPLASAGVGPMAVTATGAAGQTVCASAVASARVVGATALVIVLPTFLDPQHGAQTYA